MNFKNFQKAVARKFAEISTQTLYRVNISGDELWQTYLASFPVGSDPIYRQRTEHDCSCCKGFVRRIGNVVAVKDGKLQSIWGFTILQDEPAYQAVADALDELVTGAQIEDLFLTDEATAGQERSFEKLTEGVHEWSHFFVNIPNKHRVLKGEVDTKLGEFRAKRDVFLRGMRELTLDSVDTVIELCTQNSLYRGPEQLQVLQEYRKLKANFVEGVQVYEQLPKMSDGLARLRNTSIGTLLQELSEGLELEQAVRRYEAMVAPANYKRPTALVTKAMLDQARKTVEGLGLVSALERRYAKLTDISVENVLFADRSTRKALTGNIFDELAEQAAEKIPELKNLEQVPVAQFVKNFLPNAVKVEAFLENIHDKNLFSLIAPADPTAGKLLKWGNEFSWTYNGDVTDAIKERVKAAGGKVDGAICCRLAWHNQDDLDFHMLEPQGVEIFYAKRQSLYGALDVDMNGAGPHDYENPVENIVYGRMPPVGHYKLSVVQFNQRTKEKPGFEVDIDIGGQVYHFEHKEAARNREQVDIATIIVKKDGTVEVEAHLPATATPTRGKEVWGH